MKCWVIDTNVVVSGLLSANGPCARIIDAVMEAVSYTHLDVYKRQAVEGKDPQVGIGAQGGAQVECHVDLGIGL